MAARNKVESYGVSKLWGARQRRSERKRERLGKREYGGFSSV